MNYEGKKVALTGANGFLGKAIKEHLGFEGAEVVVLKGDIRDRRTFDDLDFSFDYLFHFAAPSSQVLFKRMPSYCIQTTLTGFMNAATAAKRHGIRLVYPSTGLLSSNQELNEYAMCKRVCEMYAEGKNMDSIGIRIFATYGPGEGHKRDYASVPYLFARDMVAGRSPVIFGDGEQVRDFIFVDDVACAVIQLAETCPDPIIDLGSGEQTSFNKLVELINKELDDTIQPVYIDKPAGYVKETAAKPKRLHDFYVPVINLEQGIGQMIDAIKEGK